MSDRLALGRGDDAFQALPGMDYHSQQALRAIPNNYHDLDNVLSNLNGSLEVGNNGMDELRYNVDLGKYQTAADFDVYYESKVEQAVEESNHTPPPLKVILLEYLIGEARGYANRVLLMNILDQIHINEDSQREVAASNKISSLFREVCPALLLEVGEEMLLDCVGSAGVQVAKEHLANMAAVQKRKSIALSGKIMERNKVELTDEEIAAAAHSSKCTDAKQQGGGKKCYPPRALYSGVAWPDEVDPKNREDYLSDTDFVSVFGISREVYQELPKFKKINLKKDKRMF